MRGRPLKRAVDETWVAPQRGGGHDQDRKANTDPSSSDFLEHGADTEDSRASFLIMFTTPTIGGARRSLRCDSFIRSAHAVTQDIIALPAFVGGAGNCRGVSILGHCGPAEAARYVGVRANVQARLVADRGGAVEISTCPATVISLGISALGHGGALCESAGH